MKPSRKIAAAIAALMVAGLSVAVPTAAHAAPGDPFDPAAPVVYIAQKAPTQLYRAETTGDGSFEFFEEGAQQASIDYNAIGFNPADNYMYGIVGGGGVTSLPPGSLVRIGQGGIVTRIGSQVYKHPGATTTPRETRWFAGAFNPADGYFYISDSGPNTTMLAIRISGNTATTMRTIDFGEQPGVQDFAFKDGYAWGADNSGAVRRLDIASGTITVFPDVLPTTTGGYGAVWNFGNGNLGFSANATGKVVQLAVTNGGTAEPDFSIVSEIDGPLSTRNDGTSIPGLPADLEIAKTGPATFVPGERISYTITVTNKGAGVSSGWTVTDTLPAGLTNPSVSTNVSSSINGNVLTVSGARLNPTQSVSFQVEADTTGVAAGSCIVNAASVAGNEEDPNGDNDEASATSCDLNLRIEKTSNATPDSRPGDTVTYTVTATNTSDGDFTEDTPAVIFDDLSGVLDDASYNGDAQASYVTSAETPSAVGYQAPLLSWSGPLAAGDAVVLTYTVTLKSGGDGVARNVAWEPEDPGITTPPSCDPATDGIDDATGQACATEQYELPRLVVSKKANRTDLPEVGQTVEYEIVVTNKGPGVYTSTEPATMTDDLSDVLDDATLVGASVTATTGTAQISGETLTWTGALAANESATIRYSVSYTGEGDQVLRNSACVPESEVLPGQQGCDLVEVPGALLTQWKTATPSSTPVVAGSTITYTLYFDNDGETAADVDAIDDIRFVLDDADLTTSPSSPDGLIVERSGNIISIKGSVPVGEVYSVSYTVTVRADGARGDSVASNFLLPPGEEPPSDGVCVPSSTTAPNCTSTPITGVSYAKSVSASETPVRAGTQLTYTLTVTNTGATTVDVRRDDALSDVLDDATLSEGPVSDTPSVTVSGPSDGILELRGTLAAGATAHVRYTVTVKEPGERGNSIASNFLVEPGTTPEGECDPTTAQCTETPIQGYSVSKVADKEIALPGETVTYTVTVTNTGAVAYTEENPASFTDDLSGVLDDATYNDDVTAGGSLSGNTLSWSGPLAVGGIATVKYSVTIDDPRAGDSVLRNAVVPTGPDGACDPDLECTTSTPVSSFTVAKEADKTSVRPGDVVTYTITVTNTGAVAYTEENPASFTDDLSGVLDDATYNDDVTAGGSLSGNTLSWSGPLAVGGIATVKYSVTVNDPVSGDQELRNAVLPVGPGGSCDPEQECSTSTPVASFTVSKEADRTTVMPGNTVTYTVTVENTGEVAYTEENPASFRDDLSGVLDDATYNDDADGGAVVAEGALRWSGPLAVGEVVTITYSVTVNDPISGDQDLANAVTPTSPGGACDPEGECSTSTLVASFTVSKEADRTTVMPGDTVTYTVTVENTGEVAYTEDDPASFTDDLSGVLDDATYNGDVTAGGSVEDGVLTWSGPLAVGQTIDVKYSVTVNDPISGDQDLANAVTPTSPGGACDPEGECSTSTLVASFTVSKEADVETVLPGGTVTYTVTVTNTGEVAYTEDDPASFTDDLSGVLDDATYNGDVTAGGSVEDGVLTWSGPLAVGQTIEVKYSVTVNEKSDGDNRLRNAVVPTGPGGECDPEDSCVTSTPVASFTVTKQADRASALPGEVVTYTVTVTNTGEVAYTEDDPASFTDDLSGVLDDARYNDDVTSGGSVSGSTLRWTGPLDIGQSIDVKYSVTIDDPVRGDFELRNVVSTDGPGGSCETCETTTPVGSYRVVKSTDAVDVVPGEKVVYTISVTNTGKVPYTAEQPASFTDDLGAVLDDALYNGDAEASDGSTVVYAAPTLSWSGALDVGETITIEYSVTVNDPATGDRRLENAVVTPPGVGGNCVEGSADPDCVANVPAASYTVEKTSGSVTALPGDVVEYAVTVTNTGRVSYTAEEPASFSDDLSRVLDDARYNGDATEGAAIDGDRLTWSGPLAVGESVTVRYSVTVNAPLSGDAKLRNVVSPTAPGGSCGEAGCVTDTPVGAYVVEKSADASQVRAGGTISYRVTVTNIGQVAYTDEQPARIHDDLSGVLDDAEYNGDATNGASVTGDRLSWSGPLDVGESVTVSYSVTVNAPLTGDGILRNVVAPDGPGGSCSSEGGCLTETPVASYRVTKKASTNHASVGDSVTYTVTIENTGLVPYTEERPAAFSDDLGAALALGSYNGDATNGAVYERPVLSWSGPLDVGESVVVTYSVTVQKPGQLENVVVTPDDAGANCAEGSADPDCATVTKVVSGLAVTGGLLWGGGSVLGLGLLAGGTWLILRRRRMTAEI